jgi:hypothetical protein
MTEKKPWQELRYDDAVDALAPFAAMEHLQNGIENRIRELHALADYCARRGKRLTLSANTVKVLTITLGAVTAARGALAAGDGSPIVFSVLAIMISVSTGLDAAFRFDRRGAALTALASEAMASARQADSDWRKRIGSADEKEDRKATARSLLSDLDKILREASATAARQGVTYTQEIYAGRSRFVPKIHDDIVG